jgi:hypothetical protein
MASRYFTRSRYAYDQEAGAAELREMLNDPDVSIADLVAAAIEHCPDDQLPELHQALTGLSEDRRGPRSWARDRLERRQLSRDMRSRDRRMGRDFGTESLTDNIGYPIENFRRSDADKEIREAGGQDRRRMGADGFAMDGVLRYIQGG